MIARIFLGKWWHWVMLIAITGVLWLAGSKRMHVIEFNTFVLGLLGIIGFVVVTLLLGTLPGEQVTRDVMRPEEDD